MKQVTIKARRKYFDTQLGLLIKKDQEYKVSMERAYEITGKNLADVVEVSDDYKTIIDNIDIDKITVNDFVDISEKSKKELEQIAKDKGIKTTGLKKQDIIDKLLKQ